MFVRDGVPPYRLYGEDSGVIIFQTGELIGVLECFVRASAGLE